MTTIIDIESMFVFGATAQLLINPTTYHNYDFVSRSSRSYINRVPIGMQLDDGEQHWRVHYQNIRRQHLLLLLHQS